jgi:hypothetical protein
MIRKIVLATAVLLSVVALPQLADARGGHGGGGGRGGHFGGGRGGFHGGFRGGGFGYVGSCWRWVNYPYPHRVCY